MRGEVSREPSRSIYSFLETAFNTNGLDVRDSNVQTASGHIRHAIDPGGKRILMIPVTEEDYSSFIDDRAGTSVSLQRERYAEGNQISPFLVFRCEPDFLRDTFAAFVDDVLDEFERDDEMDATAPVIAKLVLDRWRRLFATRGSGLLNDTALVGLAAELRVLVALLGELGPAALEAWTGPDGADHDVVLPNCSIEVKATLRKTGMEVEINGAGQLTAPDHGNLFLAASRLAFSPTGTVTVPALVDAVLACGVDREMLTKKLEAVGYHHARAEDYEKKTMDVLEDRFFRVVPEFPKIDRTVVEGIPRADRIRALTYTLDLTEHDSVPGSMDSDDATDFLREVL